MSTPQTSWSGAAWTGRTPDNRRYGRQPQCAGVPPAPRRIGRSGRPVRVVEVTPHRLSGCCAGAREWMTEWMSAWCSMPSMPRLAARWRVERGLAGGWNEGACLLGSPGGSRAVLRWRAGDPERLIGSRLRKRASPYLPRFWPGVASGCVWRRSRPRTGGGRR